MNWEQIKGLVERGVYFLVMWALAKGWIPAAVATDLVAWITTGFGLVYGWWVNRQVALVTAAASMPDVKKVVVEAESGLQKSSAPGASVTTS